jgi:hypothetical protein
LVPISEHVRLGLSRPEESTHADSLSLDVIEYVQDKPGQFTSHFAVHGHALVMESRDDVVIHEAVFDLLHEAYDLTDRD